jgi:hypothetical protein
LVHVVELQQQTPGFQIGSARLLASVFAANEKAALKTAIEQFRTPEIDRP